MIRSFVQQAREEHRAAHAAALELFRSCQRECATGGICRLGWWLDSAADSAARRYEAAASGQRNAA